MGWSKSDTFSVVAIVISVVAVIPAVQDFWHGTQKPALQITMPTAEVFIRGAPHDVSGTSQHMENLSADTDLWLVTRGDTKWYPISKIQVGANGTWSLPADLVRIGPPGKVEGQRFELVVYGVDGQTSIDFSKATASTAQGQDGGLNVLPQGSRTEYSKEWVTRTD
jgi:hypothetical protein